MRNVVRGALLRGFDLRDLARGPVRPTSHPNQAKLVRSVSTHIVRLRFRFNLASRKSPQSHRDIQLSNQPSTTGSSQRTTHHQHINVCKYPMSIKPQPERYNELVYMSAMVHGTRYRAAAPPPANPHSCSWHDGGLDLWERTRTRPTGIGQL